MVKDGVDAEEIGPLPISLDDTDKIIDGGGPIWDER